MKTLFLSLSFLNSSNFEHKIIPTTTTPDYSPHRNAWERCHYDDVMISPNYDPHMGVEYAECTNGFVCELKYQDIDRHCINCVLVFQLITIILLVAALQAFIDISKKNNFIRCPSSESAFIEQKRLASISSKEGNEPIPVL